MSPPRVSPRFATAGSFMGAVGPQHESAVREAIEVGSITFDPVHRSIRATVSGQRAELTGKESDVLHLLCMRIGSPVALEDLAALWGHPECNPTNPYRKLVARLRKKLIDIAPDLRIVPCRGAYMLLVAA